MVAGSICPNALLCSEFSRGKEDPAFLITPGGKRALIGHERQWFVDQHVSLEMSQLSNGVSKLLIQSLLVGDVNVFTEYGYMFLLKNKKVCYTTVSCSPLSFEIQILVLFFSKGNTP